MNAAAVDYCNVCSIDCYLTLQSLINSHCFSFEVAAAVAVAVAVEVVD